MSPAIRSKTSLLIIRNLIIAEVIAYAIFMVLALSADWAELYETFAISRFLSFTVLEFATLGALQVALIVFIVQRSLKEEKDIQDIIRTGEHEQLEFKTSLRWDSQRNQVNKELERSVMKTIAAFLNSEGGSLVIGLDDRRQIHGVSADLKTLAKQDHDGFENHFNNLFVSMIGPEFRQHVRLSFPEIDDKHVCLIQVERASKPVYLRSDRGEDFFIRTGNATTSLKMSQVANYISSGWR